MSKAISYLPASDNDRIIWLNNFSTKIGGYATTLGITTAEVTSVHNDAAYFSFIENMLEAYKQTVNTIVGYKNLLKKATDLEHLGSMPVAPSLGTAPAPVNEGIFDRISKLVLRIKGSLNYSTAFGNDLGIIAPVSTIDISSLQPILRV